MVATPAIEKEHGVRSSCSACHSEDDAARRVRLKKEVPTKLIDELDHDLRGRQAKIRAGIDEVNELLAEAKKRGPASETFVAAARSPINVIVNDGSMGFHNFDKAQQIIETARVLARRGVAIPIPARLRQPQAAPAIAPVTVPVPAGPAQGAAVTPPAPGPSAAATPAPAKQ